MPINQLQIESQSKFDFSDKISDVVSFLQSNYNIRIPIQDPSKIEILCKDAERYNYPPSFDDISLHLMSAGIAISDGILRKIIRSPNYIEPINPVSEYFDSIRGKWQGESQIDRFCDCITAREWDDDKPKGYYQEYKNWVIKKWLVSSVACWLDGEPNEVSLGFVAKEEGIGKTSIIKYFIPEVLSGYYVKSSRDEKKFDMEDAFTRYMIINFDELEGITKGNIDQYKKVIADDKVLTKRRYEEFPTTKNRIGVSAFSSNRNQEMGGFLPESFGYRRWGTIEVEKIDWAYNEISIDQIWSEALTLYENSDFNYKFLIPDFDRLREYNARYVIETDAMRYLMLYCSHPESEADGEKMNASQVLQRLVQSKRIKADDIKKLNSQKIGSALAALGYAKISYRPDGTGMPLKGYHIKFLE